MSKWRRSSKRLREIVARERRGPACAIATKLSAESTVHGLSKIAVSSDGRRKLVWTCLVILGLVAAIVHVTLLIAKYHKFEVKDRTHIHQQIELLFPTVTVCTLMPYSISKAVSQQVGPPYGATYNWTQFISHLPRNKRLKSYQGYYENVPLETRHITYNYDEFIVKCTFDKENCSAANFKHYIDAERFYSCFKFNHHGVKKYPVHGTGPQHGLSLILALDVGKAPAGYYNLPYIFDSNMYGNAGVRVIIHPPDTMSFPGDQGFDISPGYTTSVGLRASIHERLPRPFWNCTHERLRSGFNYKHTNFACQQLCYQERVVKVCGCASSSFPNKNASLKFCGEIKDWRKLYNDAYARAEHDYMKQIGRSQNTTSLDQKMIHKEILQRIKINVPRNILMKNVDCETRVLHEIGEQITEQQKSCHCRDPCMEHKYWTSLSFSYWPVDFYQQDLLRQLRLNTAKWPFFREAYLDLANITNASRGVELSREAEDKQKRASAVIRQNLIRLNVYMEDLSVTQYQQVPGYGWIDLLADIGGGLGLWMGISVLSIIELLELVLRLVAYFMRRKLAASGKDRGDG